MGFEFFEAMKPVLVSPHLILSAIGGKTQREYSYDVNDAPRSNLTKF